MVDFLNRFNPFRGKNRDGEPTEAQAEKQLSFTAQEWNSGEKPSEYKLASKLINIAHRMGFKTKDSVGQEVRDRWNELVRKARESGINEEEVVELKDVANTIIAALKIKTGTNPDVSE